MDTIRGRQEIWARGKKEKFYQITDKPNRKKDLYVMQTELAFSL